MGKALRRSPADGGGRRRAVTVLLAACALTLAGARLAAPDEAPRRLDVGRFTAVYFPKDDALAHSLLAYAARTDTFPGLPRPKQHVLIAIAPDASRFRSWAGSSAPDWGAALAFPDSRRVVMQGSGAGSDAGDPQVVLRHELAHLALHEQLGDLPPRWFDEGYASLSAREWKREDALAANVALALRGAPTLDELEASFGGGSSAAQAAYALSYRAVADLASLDRERGLSLFFRYWKQSGSMDVAVRRAYGMTLYGFEREYQSRTRRRYGALAVVADLSLVLFVVSVLMLPFFIARRLRDRKRLRAMLAADAAAERAAQASAIAYLLGEQGPAAEWDADPTSPHDGTPGEGDGDDESA
ncbi:MAG TPA: hypothetical protein VF034_05040 [Gemmatimonadaceae bacterium]